MEEGFMEIFEKHEPVAKIKVVGVGGAGCNAVNRMIESGIKDVDFIAINTDLQVLNQSLAKTKIQIGKQATKGLGAGARPEMGEKAAQEDTETIRRALEKSHLVFITAGMGGGTGTGAAPVVAQIAKEMGALTIAVVTIPFDFEGAKRIQAAKEGIARLKEHVDTMLVISNSRIFRIIDRKTNVKEAFHKIDEVLKQAVEGISNIISQTGLINVDFADVRTVLSNRGEAIMGIGLGRGENRAMEAAKQALENPLIENSSFRNAGAMLVNVIGPEDMTMLEWQEAAQTISELARQDAEVIVGVNIDKSLKDGIRVVIIATDFQTEQAQKGEEEKLGISADEIFSERRLVKIPEVRSKRIYSYQESSKTNREVPRAVGDEDLDTPTFLRIQRRFKNQEHS
ncbi:cell division protein FtsZ [Thermospira aquatica]|uniref:Cell division protein FtsZ n=1 Tax=Thermospira aquatica TaxID=2828656 RepID=A0AAX3BCH9_9SPIR|nr:cell division protein FtsZ [Thermospira aquatica]URA10018.1 cell division protein FtsZ [Thermospira aquatica]